MATTAETSHSANATPARTPSRKIASTTTSGTIHDTLLRSCFIGSSQPASGGCVTVFGFACAPGLSPITTVGRFGTVEAAQLATDEVWAAG